MTQGFLEATHEQGKAFFMRGMEGPVVMLNLLRFREVADYSQYPDLAPTSPISGEEAYKLYMKHTTPILKQSGGELLFMGNGGQTLIGPTDETWDLVLLVKHVSTAEFMAFAKNEHYLGGIGHRMAALEDSRLLPISQS